MGNNSLEGLRVAILATDGFEQVELEKPRNSLKQAGATTMLASPQGGTVLGLNHMEKGDAFAVDILMKDANPQNFDAVLLPGGVFNADILRMNPDARAFVRTMDKNGRPIAVICHGPWLLVSTGLVKGRRLTSYYTIQDDIRNAGGSWSDQETVLDRNWVSSRQPDDIPAFTEAMLQLFAQKRGNVRAAGTS